MYCIFIKIKILLKLGLRTGLFDLWGLRGGGGSIYFVRVRSGADWPGPLPMRAGLMRGRAARLPTPTADPLGPNIEKPDPKLATPVSEGPDPKPTLDLDPKPTLQL